MRRAGRLCPLVSASLFSSLRLLTPTDCFECAGPIKLNDDEFSVNDEFRQQAVQLADALDLDELESAKLFLLCQDDTISSDRSPLISSVMSFHQTREYRLECLELVLELSPDDDDDDDLYEKVMMMRKTLLNLLLGPLPRSSGFAPSFWRKCVDSMVATEQWMHAIADRLQSVAATDQIASPGFSEIMDFQRSSLLRQHELLGAITYWVSKEISISADELTTLTVKLKPVDRYDVILVHYIPALFYLVERLASDEAVYPLNSARSLHELVVSTKDNDLWSLRSLQSAVAILWITAYSSRFADPLYSDPSLEGIDVQAEADGRATRFMEALGDGALHFFLAISHDVAVTEWLDSAREGFYDFLLQGDPILRAENFKVSPFFREIAAEQIRTFSDAFITNMPDTLRRLKADEDEQRRQVQGRVQLRPSELELHFERFLLMIAYAYKDSNHDSEAFWADTESNLYGFLQWASQRQSTPRIAAFCEMLTSLSGNQSNADAAHRFLAQEGPARSAKVRRSSPLSWTHITDEIAYFNALLRERLAQPASVAGKSPLEQAEEPETSIMLESYLRLLAHLCRQSSETRRFFLYHATFRIHEQLLTLCASNTQSTLRACAFTALASLLTEKDSSTNEGIWSEIDEWILAGKMPGSTQTRPTGVQVTATSSQKIFESIAHQFEEPNSFTGLLNALITPYDLADQLHDSLPFPEKLGQSYRMQGINPYVDFVIGKTFSNTLLELQDPVQVRILRWQCLGFVMASLSGFNEELPWLANRSKMNVDGVIDTENLGSYLRLHPFARTMEWLFNDKVVAALFATACQDITLVNEVSSASPLVEGLLRSIEVIEMIMRMQSTYFEIVRPHLKLAAGPRSSTVANAGLASFEDVILNNLNFVTSLMLYCGSGHEVLVIKSLRLLQRLSMSPKLATPVMSSRRGRLNKSRLVVQLEQYGDTDLVCRPLVDEMRLGERELEQGPECSGILLKSHILDFLVSSLSTVSDGPTLAHMLLGLSSNDDEFGYSDDGLFARGKSLFHSIAAFLVDCPDLDAGTLLPWLQDIRVKAWQILIKLLTSKMSFQLVSLELRAQGLFFIQAIRQIPLNQDMLWEGRSILDDDFMVNESATAYLSFLRQRNLFLEYATIELRLVNEMGLSTLKDQMTASLFGKTTLSDGQEIENMTAFEHFDILDFPPQFVFEMPESRFFDPEVLSASKNIKDNFGMPTYNTGYVSQLLELTKKGLKKQGKIGSAADEEQIHSDAEAIMLYVHGLNQYAAVYDARIDAVTSWARLVAVMLESCQFTLADRNAVVVQLLQLVLPRLERAFMEDAKLATILIHLAQLLLGHVDFANAAKTSKTEDNAGDRLFQLFCTGIAGIQIPDCPEEVREPCYQICYAYLCGICKSKSGLAARQNALESVQPMLERLVQVLCNDAYSGDGQCRLSALHLLGALVTLYNQERSNRVVQSFARLNFVRAIIENIATLSRDLSSLSGECEISPMTVPHHVSEANTTSDVTLALSYHDASLSLLLRLAQTRPGAGHVLSAGFFQAIRESGVFSVDPDIGFGQSTLEKGSPHLDTNIDPHADLNNPEALTRYLDLMLAMLHVLNAIVLSMGSENDAVLALTRQFIQENRLAISSIFKRSARIGHINEGNKDVIDKLVGAFTLLMSASGFLDVRSCQSLPNCIAQDANIQEQTEEEAISSGRPTTVYS